MSPSSDLVVLGAGPAGLAAAWLAARRGFSVTVLERGEHVGGLAASVEVAGVRVDQGSHRLHPATPADVLSDLRSLLGDDLQTRPRNGRLLIAGRWVGFPLRGGELLRRLPPGLVAGLARDAATAPLRRPGADTYAEVLRAGLGPTLYDALYRPYAEKLWGLPGDRIDGDQARRRVAAPSAWKIAARLVGPPRARTGRVFHYPRRGFGQIADALADAAVAAGAEIRLGADVETLRVRNDSVSVETTDGTRAEAAHAFSTIPLPALARRTRPGPPLAAIEAAGRLRFRAMVLVYLVHEGGRWSPYDAHYLPSADTPVSRVSEPANYRDSDGDPGDRTVLCAEIPCSPGDRLWRTPDDELGTVVEDALAASGLPPVRRAGVHVRRLAHVYPIYTAGYARHLISVDVWARSLPTVTTFGRLGLFAHDNTHHAMAMAYQAVDAFTDERRFDRIAWAAARDRFHTHVVED